MLQQDTPLNKTIEFIAYIDQLKNVIRMNGLFDASRAENTAEHSWHAALSAVLLAPFANEPVDAQKVTYMLLIHDLIEIEVGDTFVYDAAEVAKQELAERQAADFVFNKLPDEVAATMRALWDEFEAMETPEAKFAKAIDRFLPIFSNLRNDGYSWRPHDISQSQVRQFTDKIRDGSAPLWDILNKLIEQAVDEGALLP